MRGRFRWFGNSECKSGDGWVSVCRIVKAVGEKSRGRRQGQEDLECVNDSMEGLGLQLEWAVFGDVWRSFISGQNIQL